MDDTAYSPIHDNFKTCRQLHMLIIGEPRDMKNNKGSRDLTAVSLEIPVSGVKHNVSSLVFSLCMSAWPRYELQQCHCFMLPLLTLLAEATIT